jgi:hypothetical protein
LPARINKPDDNLLALYPISGIIQDAAEVSSLAGGNGALLALDEVNRYGVFGD